MHAEPPDQQANNRKRASTSRAQERVLHQVQVRLVGHRRQEVEAALALLQAMAGVQVQRGPRLGRKGEWLVYATISVSTEGAPEKTHVV